MAGVLKVERGNEGEVRVLPPINTSKHVAAANIAAASFARRRRELKLGMLGKWRHRRGVAWSFVTWKRESRRRAEASKLLSRVAARQAREEARHGWAAFVENALFMKRASDLRER